MRKFKLFLIGLGIFVLLILILAIPTKNWLTRFLSRGIDVDTFQIRLIHPVVNWHLGFSADSLVIRFPEGLFVSAPLWGQVKTFQSLIHFKPNLELDLGEAVCILNDTLPPKTKPKDSVLAFPKITLPFPFEIKATTFSLKQKAKVWVQLKGLNVQAANLKKVSLHVDSLSIPGESNPLEKIKPSLDIILGWRDSVRVKAELGWGVDRIKLLSGRSKANLLFGYDSLEVTANSLATYQSSKLSLPLFSKLALAARFQLKPYWKITGQLNSQAPLNTYLDPQTLGLNFMINSGHAKIDATSQGSGDESMQFNATIQWPVLDTLPGAQAFTDWLNAWQGRMEWSSQNVRIHLGHDILPGDVETHNLTLSPGLNIKGDLITRDQSALQVNMNLHPFKVDFSGSISSTEKWANHWTDTNVTFQNAKVKGNVDAKGATRVTAKLGKVHAYGAEVDSAIVEQYITAHGYYLDTATLFLNREAFEVKGQVEWPHNLKTHLIEPNLFFSVYHPQLGFAQYHMPNMHSMEAKAENVSLGKWPYKFLQRLDVYQPKVTAKFDWDWLKQKGQAQWDSKAIFQEEDFFVKGEGNWDKQVLDLADLQILHSKSHLRTSGKLNLRGRQFYDLAGTRIKDVKGINIEARDFDIAEILNVLSKQKVLESGYGEGNLSYTDTSGFTGEYKIKNLKLRHSAGDWSMPELNLMGKGRGLTLMAITQAPKQTYWNDTLHLNVQDFFADDPVIEASIQNREGWRAEFSGVSPGLLGLKGDLRIQGKYTLPEGLGSIQNFKFASSLFVPFHHVSKTDLFWKSYQFQGDYCTVELDTLKFKSSLTLQNGILQVPDFILLNKAGEKIVAHLVYDLASAKAMQVDVQSEKFGLKFQGRDDVGVRALEANFRIDSLGLALNGHLAQAFITSFKPPIKLQSELLNVQLSYLQPFAKANEVDAPRSTLKLQGKMRNFLFAHKIGFQQISNFFKTFKSDRKKKKTQPIDVEIALETLGTENRLQTDILRMNFTGDINIRGTYPYALSFGQFSALTGEIGQVDQSYAIRDFDLKWQNAPMEEGLISVEGEKKLFVNCKPETKKTCLVNIHLLGQLDDMRFSYSSDCGEGETVEIPALINSVNRGCYAPDLVSGSGENYGHAALSLLEPTINKTLTGVVGAASNHWIANTSVSGLGAWVSNNKDTSEVIALAIESKEKYRLTAKARSGYRPEKTVQNPWEYLVAVEWRPPFARVIRDTSLSKKMEERLRIEASAETRNNETPTGEENQVRKQVGLRYRYKFWNLW